GPSWPWTSASRGERISAAAAVSLALALIAIASAGLSAAHAAKKKCKRADSAAIAKKCKKPRAVLPPAPGPIPPAPLHNPPAPPPPPPPVLRVEIQWAENADVDVHVWDSAGNHASTKSPNGIPGVSFSADDTDGSGGGGLEQVFAQPNDKLIVGI